MGILERIRTVLKSNINALISKAEDPEKMLNQLVMDIKEKLGSKIKDFEVAINLISGTGKEHMAILSAVMKLGLGMRLVVLSEKGLEEI